MKRDWLGMSRTGGIQMQEKFNPSHTIEAMAFFCLFVELDRMSDIPLCNLNDSFSARFFYSTVPHSMLHKANAHILKVNCRKSPMHRAVRTVLSSPDFNPNRDAKNRKE
jgi:hypothetical protein